MTVDVRNFHSALAAHRLVVRFVWLLTVIGLATGSADWGQAAAKTTTKTTAKKPEPKSNAAAKKPETAKATADDDEKDEPKKKRNPDQDDDEKPDEDSKKEPQAPTSYTLQTIPLAIDPLIRATSKAASWGVKIVIRETGASVFEYNQNTPFIPASNRKIFTSALALDQLGPNFKFQTVLYRTGKVEGSLLKGNLVIKPSGDPTFNSEMYRASHTDWVFRDWAKKVADSGVTAVQGDLLIDCSDWNMRDMTPRGWPGRIMQDNYAPQTSPLTLNENLVNVIVNPGDKGQPGVVTFAPPAPGYPISNQTVSGGKGRVSIKRSSSGLIASGVAAKAGGGAVIPCDNPTLFAAANFRHHLKEAGVTINGAVRMISTKGALPGFTNESLIAVVESPPMSEIVKHLMKHSNNHFAEQVYVAISAAKLGTGGYTASRRLEETLLVKAGINPKNMGYYDGSGLSELNRVSPDQVCKVLNFMMTHPAAGPFFDSMAVSGRDGTLAHRMGTPQLAGRVHAKTGTINYVKCLSGYLTLAPNRTLTFSFLVNNIRGGSISGTMDRICGLLSTLVI